MGLPPELLLETNEPRRSPFVFRLPFIVERHYRIHPPPGMVVRSIPRDGATSVGTGQLEQRFVERGGIFHVTLRFDSGPTEITPKQYEGYRQGVRELFDAEPIVLEFSP